MNTGQDEHLSTAESDTSAGEPAAEVHHDAAPAEAPVEAPVEAAAPTEPAPERASPTPSPYPMRWFVLRVASNREEQVRDALVRKVKIEALEERVGRILVPTQREKRVRGGQTKFYERKLYPGYVFVEMAPEADGSVPENVWFVIKDTSGVGDFIGSDGKPSEMKPHDVEKMLAIVEAASDTPTLAGMAGMKKGDLVKVKEGPFENFEGEVDEVMPDKGQVRVIVTIFGRATPIELEYWQVESA
ncbi:MAG: transcription termination/antitermination protein NusG [Phycisphaerae bacterium]|nr:transcription termination/antitermination protein NusG [Phycisphaerae bacterium]